MFGTAKGISVAVFCVVVAVSIFGCNVEGRRSTVPGISPTDSTRLVRTGPGIDMSTAEEQEVDLVEALVSHRRQYLRTLRRLHDYYNAHGYTTKQHWTALELEGMNRVQKFRYLLDAEVASDDLRPEDRIAEADALYEQGLELMRRGGHGVLGIYRQDRMIEAADLFRDLIERYPSSDKIDDAAFYCGEIHKDYLPGQELIAVKWYERAYTWDPQTPHPARFQAAVIYDYRLHNRDRALELYQAVVKHETGDKRNVRFATRRIRGLTGAGRTLATP